MSRVQRVVLATANPAKLAELRRVLAASGAEVEVLGLSDFHPYPPPEETERTFDGNALLKANAAARHTGLVALADDSGLEVDELNAMPGVRSSRWAGPEGDDQANLELLLRQLQGVPQRRRKARFVCALALVGPDMAPIVFSGEMRGHIAEAPAGSNGFGYDPVFVPEGHQVTTAQMSPGDKDALSHRGRALAEFVAWLKEQ